MSYDTTLGRRRTVRFPAETDRLLQAEAASAKKTISEVIREKVESHLGQQKTAGESILEIAAKARRRVRSTADNTAFIAAYTRRHKT